MEVAIVKYNAGNIRSVELALERIGIQAIITEDHDRLRNADRVILPGVGEASTAMTHLKANGLDAVLLDLRQPVLGICLGLQLLCQHTEEGDTAGLGIFDAKVHQFELASHGLKVPHVGWSQIALPNISDKVPNQLLDGITIPAYVYFVHSYFATVGPDTIAICTYGHPFSAALRKGNYYATQFHPEKSADVGNRILQNFIDLQV